MRSFRTALLVMLAALPVITLGAPRTASNTPIQSINTFIEGNECSGGVRDWNRKYFPSALTGETSRSFYYRAIRNQEWGSCGKPYIKIIFAELRKAWDIYQQGRATQAEIEAKEKELVTLLIKAHAAGDGGDELVEAYVERTTGKLFNHEPELQYYNCTYFGPKALCED